MRQGIQLNDRGIQFSVAAPHAETVELCLFREGEETRHELTPGEAGRHMGEVAGVRAGDRYGLRTHGPWDPSRGLLHQPTRLLLDPYARAVAGGYEDHPVVHATSDGTVDSGPHVPRGVVVEAPPAPRPGPGVPWGDTVIYETHVRGLTKAHPDVDPELQGTYLGAVSEPVLDHLTGLGVTTVELMPVAHHVSEPFLQSRGLTNYWGYSTLAWFAPHAGYATDDDGRQVAEFATMVDRFHAAGLEVIVDVVFNHTAEGGSGGPILSMKGLDNPGWYRLDPADPSRYVDWTGTGNTIDTGSPMVREAILDALRWWCQDLGVDGFRFDLAVTMGRAESSFHPDNLRWLTEDPVVGQCKLIAEPWDLGPHGYQLGGFGTGWAEWNGTYRDEMRDVWRGKGSRGSLAQGFSGSHDLFPDRGPLASVNFITAHDGFTLSDLVSYDDKRNQANGEDNRDGHSDNRSWNSGVEGPTEDEAVLEIRRRRSGAMITTLILSLGVPMVLGGDELGRTQGGNNNAYAIDDPTTWYDWSSAVLAPLVRVATMLRRNHPLLRSGLFLTDGGGHPPDVWWRTIQGDDMADWDHAGPLVAELSQPDDRIVVAFNPTGDHVDAVLPEGEWRLELDSCQPGRTEAISGTVHLPAWTVLALTPSEP